MREHSKFDSIMLAAVLICITGVSLAYNIHSSKGGDIAVSLTDIMDYPKNEASAVSKYAAAHFIQYESVAVSAEPREYARPYELQGPVVFPTQ